MKLKFVKLEPGTRVITMAPGFSFGPHHAFLASGRPFVCPPIRYTGSELPACVVCHAIADMKLAAIELDRFVNEGGPARD